MKSDVIGELAIVELVIVHFQEWIINITFVDTFTSINLLCKSLSTIHRNNESFFVEVSYIHLPLMRSLPCRNLFLMSSYCNSQLNMAMISLLQCQFLKRSGICQTLTSYNHIEIYAAYNSLCIL
jgi:hypothetical protein